MTHRHDADTGVPILPRYTGQYRDPVLEDYRLGHAERFYLPALMRFATRGDEDLFDGGNAYGYCGVDPVNRAASPGHGPWPASAPAPAAGRYAVSPHAMAGASMSGHGGAAGAGTAASTLSSSSLAAVSAVATAAGAGSPGFGPGLRKGAENAGQGGTGATQGRDESDATSRIVLVALAIAGLMLGIGFGAIGLRRYTGAGMKQALRNWTHTWAETPLSARFARGDVSRLVIESGLHLSNWRVGVPGEPHADELSAGMAGRRRAQSAPAPVSAGGRWSSRGRSSSYATTGSSGYGSLGDGAIANTEAFEASAEQHESAYVADEPAGWMGRMISLLGGRL